MSVASEAMSVESNLELAQNEYNDAKSARDEAVAKEAASKTTLKTLRESLEALKQQIAAQKADHEEWVKAKKGTEATFKEAKNTLADAKRAANEQKKAEKAVKAAAKATA